MPLKLSKEELINISNQLISEPYGWGGINEYRDCSALTLDMAMLQNVWIPRNSYYQSKQFEKINLASYSKDTKKLYIKRHAIPFRTLVYLRGHIMLYVGQYKGKPIVMHNTWGVKYLDKYGNKSRYHIGKTVLTTLDYDKRLGINLFGGTILERIESITIF
jgi:hypothetical protein